MDLAENTNDLGELPRVFSNIHHRRKRQFLAAYALTGRLSKAFRLTGINERFHYFWKEKDPEYVEAFKKAQEIAADRAEDEVYRRGIEGYEKPLQHKGYLTGHVIREYSDNLAMFVLKGLRPEKYRENVVLQQSSVSALQLVLNTSPDGKLGEGQQGAKLVLSGQQSPNIVRQDEEKTEDNKA